MTCPDATVDGSFATVVCEVGQATLNQPGEFPPILWIGVDGGPCMARHFVQLFDSMTIE